MEIWCVKLANFYNRRNLLSKGELADLAHCDNIWWSERNSQNNPEQFREFLGLKKNEENREENET